jgi:UDP-2,3-diacylglucosamine pyrophosphatase LpxH
MQLAVISDLHLGHGRADLFGHEHAQFLRFLDHLEQSFERVVLLGDIFETLTVRPGAQVRELRRARESHKALAERFERPMYRYVHGNHDLVAGPIDGRPDALHLKVDGQRIAFLHGHQFDWVVKKARFVSEWSAWLAAWVVRLGLTPVLKVTGAVERLVMGVDAGAPSDPTRLSRPDRFQRAAMSWASAQGVDIVVTGHTHHATVAPHGDRLFLNSGSCSEGRISYLAMDTAAGRYSVETAW